MNSAGGTVSGACLVFFFVCYSVFLFGRLHRLSRVYHRVFPGRSLM